MIKIFLADLQTQHKNLRIRIQDAVNRVLESGRYVNGPEKGLFELEFASFAGARFAIGTGSGADAMAISLRAMGIGEGDDVIIPANSFQSNAEAVILSGANPVLCDVVLDTGLMDVENVKKAWTANTRAVIVVHLWGHVVEMHPIISYAKLRGAYVIENCAQAVGSKLNGAHVGTFGDVGAFSFFPGNTLGGVGDGGMAITDSQDTAIAIRAISNHGRGSRNSPVGCCGRLDDIQAAVCRVKMKYLSEWVERRKKIKNLIKDQINDINSISMGEEVSGAEPAPTFAIVAVKKRDELKDHLFGRGIFTSIHYSKPIHLQSTYKFLGYNQGDFPNAEKLCNSILSLPCFPEMKKDDVIRVVKEVREFFR